MVCSFDTDRKKLNALPSKTPIEQARRTISSQCRQAAERPGGVFRLSVPTSGGKTLSSLRFAPAHARQFQKQRIIFTSPLLSILDQNAKEIRKYIQDDSLILEHHSNLVCANENGQQLDERELLIETWEAPVIITTLVQLLNTLFSGTTTCIRRFHSLCSSVIVIDEVQTVPSKMLSLFSLAINFLAKICKATVVLCSATQPCTEQIGHPIHGPILEIIPYDINRWNIFQRTDIQSIGTRSLKQIADFALEKLEYVDSLLLVCNTKAEAKSLYRLLKNEGFILFSLSADTQGKMTARFWYPVMKQGAITFPHPKACPLTKPLREMKRQQPPQRLQRSGGDERCVHQTQAAQPDAGLGAGCVRPVRRPV